MIHQLKCREDYFEDICSGKKKFEVRKKDRPFQVGDFLVINEIALGSEQETGRCILLKIIYILDSKEFCKEDYVVIGFDYCTVESYSDITPRYLSR